jgi:SAM-dependent methyltransferase
MVLLLDVDDGEVATRRRFQIVRTSELVPPRADYKTTWDAEAADLDSAKNAVSGYTDDAEYERTALELVELFERVVGVHPSDTFLEIGCGVGRVAPALAPKVARWIGCDVSANMLDHARQRLQRLANVELVELNGWDLAPIPSESIDVVYCTVVFMHLDEWERFAYVREAMRVLRPGGRIYIDNFNLCSDPGWAFFMEMAESYHPLGRPPNISKSSTPDELRTYLERAEFGDVSVGASGGGLFVFAHARKPGG